MYNKKKMAGASEPSKYKPKMFSPGFSRIKSMDISAMSVGKGSSASKPIEHKKTNKELQTKTSNNKTARKLFGGKRRKSSKRRRSRKRK